MLAAVTVVRFCADNRQTHAHVNRIKMRTGRIDEIAVSMAVNDVNAQLKAEADRSKVQVLAQ